MRVTVLVGGFIGFLVTALYTLHVMEWREEFGRSYWAVAATAKPRVGYQPAWLIGAMWSVLPVLFGGLLGNCEWDRRSVRWAAAGALLVVVAAWLLSGDLVAKHGRAGENTRGILALAGLFAGALAGAKASGRLGRGDSPGD